MNVSLDELNFIANDFELDEQHYFTSELKNGVEANNITKLESLLKSQDKIYSLTGNFRNRHNMALINIHIAHLNHSTPSHDAIETIEQYLLTVDAWGYYEFLLYTNSLVALPTDIILLLSKQAYQRGVLYSPINIIQNQQVAVLINTISAVLKRHEFSQVNLFIKLAENDLASSNWLFEILIVKFFKSCYLLMKDPASAEGKQGTEAALDILITLGKSSYADSLKKYKAELLNSTI
ncbi:hypothetical protein EQG49_06600 [Periweissella cryptocerci]|uniref:HTH-type transcriptional regulator Rgg C-terminal domain-containing protein n=1 Tax=Periweissella cryptocerci TaxID=2506420 RepID=A0A4P6YTX3_9LACO|nr:hypothetical protein EQG49_06600 [Periweissella cryptocerci]